MRKRGRFYHISSCSYAVLSLKCQKCSFFVYSADNRKKLVTMWAKCLSEIQRSFRNLSENGVADLIVLLGVTVHVLTVETSGLIS